jgi:DNA-binding GntR family transcriptional regulator
MREHATKSAYAASVLRRALSDGVYGAGDRLTTAKLAKELGLSMTPVREALIELANEGLVEIAPHRGARVAELALADLSEVYLAREILEPAATRLAVPRLDAVKIRELRRLHKAFVAAAKVSDSRALLELNAKFHFAIYDASDSPLLNRLIRTVWSSSPNDTFRLIPGRAARSVKDHTAVLKALVAGDVRAAETAMRLHIHDSLGLIEAYKKRRRA